jgi:flagellar biosynthesis protein FliR
MMSIAKLLVILGVVFLVAGGLVYLFSRLGLSFGRLPGDIRVQGQNATCVIALGTSILLSILLTIVLNVIIRLMNR